MRGEHGSTAFHSRHVVLISHILVGCILRTIYCLLSLHVASIPSIVDLHMSPRLIIIITHIYGQYFWQVAVIAAVHHTISHDNISIDGPTSRMNSLSSFLSGIARH